MENKKTELTQLSAQRLKLLLKEKNMKQKELAPLIYVTEQTVSNWIKGHKGISEDNAQRIVKVLMDNPDRFSVDWLLGKSEYRTEQEYLAEMKWAEAIKKAYPVEKINRVANYVFGIAFDYRKKIIPLDDQGKPIIVERADYDDFYEKIGIPRRDFKDVDLSDKSVSEYAIASISLKDNSIQGDYDAVFERNELATIVLEVIQSITNKIQFEVLYHNKRFSDSNALDDITDDIFYLGENYHAEEE